MVFKVVLITFLLTLTCVPYYTVRCTQISMYSYSTSPPPILRDRRELQESFTANNSLLTMDLYDDLASNEEGYRIKAAEELVTRIIEGQSQEILRKERFDLCPDSTSKRIEQWMRICVIGMWYCFD
jgi:hypothetical protein